MSVAEYPETAHGPTITHNKKEMTVRLRHDALLKVTTKWAEADRPNDVDYMTVEQLDGYLLTLGCLYNVSGYYNPYKPKVNFKIVNKNDILQEGELCTCRLCNNYPEEELIG